MHDHASIIDGIWLCKAQKCASKSTDMEDLESRLQQDKNSRIKLIVSGGSISMDGKNTPLHSSQCADWQIMLWCFWTNAMLPVSWAKQEEARRSARQGRHHQFYIGQGPGWASGGYTTGPNELINLLRQHSRPYLFSNIPSSCPGAARC